MVEFVEAESCEAVGSTPENDTEDESGDVPAGAAEIAAASRGAEEAGQELPAGWKSTG